MRILTVFDEGLGCDIPWKLPPIPLTKWAAELKVPLL